ncbi:MAG: PorT family protein [Bryobacteraceae bacterium]|nr:PorT family protein [Bryobacteraceae bacterium]
MQRIILFSLLFASLAHAQWDQPFRISGGFKLGAPVDQPAQDFFSGRTIQESRWTGGPTVELSLPGRFAIAFEALYRNRRENSSGIANLATGFSPFQVNGKRNTNTWDLPLLLKYRFRVGPARPFVNAGYQWSRESFQIQTSYLCTDPAGGPCVPRDFPVQRFGGSASGDEWKQALVAGGGLEFKTRYVTIAPEVRWTRAMQDGRQQRVFGLVGFRFGR